MFEEMISPISFRNFEDQYLDKNICAINIFEGDKHGFDFLRGMTKDALMKKISEMRPVYPLLSMAKDGERLPPENFCRKVSVGEDSLLMSDPDKIEHLFRNGTTVILQGVENWLPEVSVLCGNLSNSVNAVFGANIYISPPSAPAFAPHYDTHDVFAIQVFGKKKWRLGGQMMKSPLAEQKYFAYEFSDIEFSSEQHLIPGQGIYIPRGTLHEAEADEEVSVHMTLGMSVTTYWDVLKMIVESKGDCSLRKSAGLKKNMIGSNVSINMQTALQVAAESTLDASEAHALHQFTLVANAPKGSSLKIFSNVQSEDSHFKISPSFSHRFILGEYGMDIALGAEVVSLKYESHQRIIDFIARQDDSVIAAKEGDGSDDVIKYLSSIGFLDEVTTHG